MQIFTKIEDKKTEETKIVKNVVKYQQEAKNKIDF